MIRVPFEWFYSVPGATATGASAVADQKPTESRENRLYPVGAVRQTGLIPTMESVMVGVSPALVYPTTCVSELRGKVEPILSLTELAIAAQVERAGLKVLFFDTEQNFAVVHVASAYRVATIRCPAGGDDRDHKRFSYALTCMVVEAFTQEASHVA